MSVEHERLVGLIEFVEQATRLRAKPVSAVAQHGQLALYEHELSGLPGVHLNPDGAEADDEIWLRVERLREAPPPPVESGILRPWIHESPGPVEVPRLRDTVTGLSLIAAGTHTSFASSPTKDKPSVDPAAAILLSEYDQADLVRSDFRTYVDSKWRVWAAVEARRRSTISLYAKLFTLHQQLGGDIVDAQLELVWGVGMGIWATPQGVVSYPLLTQLVDLSLDPGTAAIEVRPRDREPKLEVDWYASVDNGGVGAVERSFRDFLDDAEATFSPFERGTFEAPLRVASAHLDANGVYWPDQQTATDDRLPPSPDQSLKVTDTWLLFARPRTNSAFLSDLEALKQEAADSVSYPPAVAAIVTDPEESNVPVALPQFRGAWTAGHSTGEQPGLAVRDLFFPKPFNDEQVRIVQLLEVSNGVVVQGPPGTGKTHTIANVICHFLAQGKRVLVTSMKDSALRVLHDELPEDIRPLAISLLSSEHEGMKQFEHAITKIASEVQRLDPSATAERIDRIEESIDAGHAQLALLDREVGEWARLNLTSISLDGEEIIPEDAAHDLAESAREFEQIPDPLGLGAEFAPRFSDADVAKLRDARRILGRDIEYVTASLPQLADVPDALALLRVHQDLSRFELLKEAVASGEIPSLADAGQETLDGAQLLLADVEALAQARSDIARAGRPWAVAMRGHLRAGTSASLVAMVDLLGGELEATANEHHAFLSRPVTAPEAMEFDDRLVDAVANLSDGKRPFGLIGGVGKASEKRLLESVRVLTVAPQGDADWRHVRVYLAFRKRCAELALRWNALAAELGMSLVPVSAPEGALLAAQDYEVVCQVRSSVGLERRIAAAAGQIFPNWAAARDLANDAKRLDELQQAVRHHLTKSRLSDVWASKERFQQVLRGRSGGIIDDFNRCLVQTLGNPTVPDVQMQSEWSSLTAELARVHGLEDELGTVRSVSEAIRASGAPLLAEMLTRPAARLVDELLPIGLRKSWRLRRLATYLDSIDAQAQMKQLAEDRREAERALARDYSELVVSRTWLKLSENASPAVRSALQAYLNAIQKMGKGTGKRAARHRRDARAAAAQANPAVPCWIMPHYRVSESLPSQLGCFDLVIVDEASQSDLSALPSLLRGQKVLVVGDDKQVSPEAVGIEEEKVVSLMTRFLGNQVKTYRAQMSPTSSIYDLFKVVFAAHSVMLREHFRSVAPIIEYSKREFYDHEIRPLRIPKASERLDPPLIDVLIRDGFRQGDENRPEARFIVDEIKRITDDPHLNSRSIGVVSLLADKQAKYIWDTLARELGPEIIQRHKLTCGDARTFQGEQRDIMFLSMVAAPNETVRAITGSLFAQRFNVAASRARDRMYLVRSVEAHELSLSDIYRRSLIAHFHTPFHQDETRVQDLRELCESGFEREMYDELTARDYRVTPQVHVGQSRVDFLVEGDNDARLAVECDGDRWHGPDRWDTDMQRQRVLERTGLVFWRCFASTFVRRRTEVLDDLLRTLAARGIDPIGAVGAPRSVYTEHREVHALAPPGGGSSAEREYPAPVDQQLNEVPEVPEPGVDQGPDVVGAASPLVRPNVEPPYAPSHSAMSSQEVVPRSALPSGPTAFAAYAIADLWTFTTRGPLRGEVDATLRPMIAESVRVEGPVHFETIMEGLRRRYGIGRAKESTRSHVLACIERLAASGAVEMTRRDAGADLFLSQYGATATPRSPGASGLRRPEHIAMSELMAGVLLVLKDLGPSYREELIIATAREFGFKRTSVNMHDVLDAAIQELLRTQAMGESFGHLRTAVP